MRATGPATRPTLSCFKLSARPFNPTISCLLFFGRLNPTDPLIARQRGNILPCHLSLWGWKQATFLNPPAFCAPPRLPYFSFFKFWRRVVARRRRGKNSAPSGRWRRVGSLLLRLAVAVRRIAPAGRTLLPASDEESAAGIVP